MIQHAGVTAGAIAVMAAVLSLCSCSGNVLPASATATLPGLKKGFEAFFPSIIRGVNMTIGQVPQVSGFYAA